MTDQQLKLALARMLPDDIAVYPSVGGEMPELFSWKDPGKRQIFDTEWLHVCWLVEKTLSDKDHAIFRTKLMHTVESLRVFSCSWEQRAIPLCHVKGIAL